MGALEDLTAYINLELPRRSVFLTKAITGHDADPNVGAPAIISGAPLGSWFREETAAKWWRKTETVWEDNTAGGGSSDHAGAGADSMAVGAGATATALRTTSVGDTATATAQDATAVGALTEATAQSSIISPVRHSAM